MANIGFDWDAEDEERTRRQQADAYHIELQALKKRQLIRAIASFLGVLALIGLIIFLRQKIAEQEVQNEFRQTISGEIQAIRVGDLSTFLGYQDNVGSWIRIQWDAFDEYRRESSRIVAGNQILDSQSDGTHGHVVLQELVDGKPYQVIWFYDYVNDGWKHTAPPPAYWGAAQHLSGEHADIDYLSLDANQASAMRSQIDDWWQTACQLTACGQGGPERIRVHVNFDLQLNPRWSPDDPTILEIPSPHLRRVPVDGTLDPAFKQVLARLLAEHWANWAAPARAGAGVDVTWLHDELAIWLAHAMAAGPTAPLLGPLESRVGSQGVMALVSKVRGGEGAIPALGEVSGADPLDPAFGWQDYLATQLRAEAALPAPGNGADTARTYGDLPPMSPGSIQVSSVAQSGDIYWTEVTFSPPGGDDNGPTQSTYVPFRVVADRWAHSPALPTDFGAMQASHSAHVTLHVPTLDAPLTGGLVDDVETSFIQAESDLGIAPGEIGGLDVTIAPQVVTDDPWDAQAPSAVETPGTPAMLNIRIESPHLTVRSTSHATREALLGQIARDMLIQMIRYRAVQVNPRSAISMAIARWELDRQGQDADAFLPVTVTLSGEGHGTLDRVWTRRQDGPFVLEDVLGARALIDLLVRDHGPHAVSALLSNLADAKDVGDWLSKSLNVSVTDIEARWTSATQTAISLAGGDHAPESTLSPDSHVVMDGSDSLIDVMMSDSGKTISLTVGQSFRLNLNPNPDVVWSVKIADPSVVVLIHQVNAATGAQWTYMASKAGRTSVSATTGTTFTCISPGVPCVTDKTSLEWEVVVH